MSRVFQGSTDASVFEDFIEQLIQHCGKWPESNSVLVIDNVSFHHSDRIEQIYSEASVKHMYLPSYSSDLIKAFIRRNWHSYEETPEQRFDNFLEWCVNVVGAREKSAEGHF